MTKYNRVDLHSHILPNLDDGADSVEMSIQILQALKEQQVQTVACTPHFYLQDNSVNRFLQRREKAWNMLKEALPVNIQNACILGAEVYYTMGMYQVEHIEKLAYGSSEYILIELPYQNKIDIDLLEDLQRFAHHTGLILVLAHIERFLDKFTWRAARKLSSMDFFFQINTGSLTKDKSLCKTTLKWLKKGMPTVIGSDSHNMNTRSPYSYEKGLEVIREALGEKRVEQLLQLSEELACEAQKAPPKLEFL